MLTELVKRLLHKPEPLQVEGITPVRQRFDYDCGQTCLDMLGYDGHGMFPDKPVTWDQMRNIPGTIDLDRSGFRYNSSSYFERPAVVSARTTDLGTSHWFIAYQDKVVCPTIGVRTIKDYDRMIWTPNNVLEIPPKIALPSEKEPN